MAQAGGGDSQVVSQFPLPPRQLYAGFARDADALPAPPPPPGADTSYAMFGAAYATSERLPTLEESGRACLYDKDRPASEELRRLNAQLLHLFHCLLVTLSTPGAPHEHVVARIEDTFINMHHLLNTLRPAQAVRDLRVLLERQCAARRDAAAALRAAEARATGAIAAAAHALAAPSADTPESAAEVAAALAVVEEHIAREQAGDTLEAQRQPDDPNAPAPLGWYHGDDDGVAATLSAAAVEADAGNAPPRPPPFSEELLSKIDAIMNDPAL